MKISLDWLSDYISWVEKDPLKIAECLTISTAEIEEVEVQGKFLENCCVGKVESVEKHPDADRLNVCAVATDKGKKQVVCGGMNVKQGMLVAFAHIGATVKWHGEDVMTLAPVKIRGVESFGMICAAEELGLDGTFPSKKEDGERAIIDLSNSGFKVGAQLREALGLTDVVFDVNNTAITMRPDLFSHIGFARECVALGLAKWKKEPVWKIPKTNGKGSIKMKVDAAKEVSRYLACELSIDGIGETPDWMKQRLQTTGWRPVNLPVDITNYVMMETGLPLHSFDAGDIKGDVHLRLSKKGEEITTLDNSKHVLTDGALVLSDDAGIFDLLGIMGGMRSSTKESTRHVYLHAAALDPKVIRRGITATGHRTDAATVYEKGVQPITAEQGFARALALFLELVPGAKVTSAIESKGVNGKLKPIALSLERVKQMIGIEIPEKEIVKMLTNLGCSVKKGAKKILNVTPPLHRARDIKADHDLVEEIGRIHGYNNLPDVMPLAPMRVPALDHRLHRVRDGLATNGFMEIVPLSFVSKWLLEKCRMNAGEALLIANPLGDETSLLQTSTLPALLAHAERYLPLVDDEFRTFHWSHVFKKKDREEWMELSALLCKKSSPKLKDEPLLVLKEDILKSFAPLGIALRVDAKKDPLPHMHPGRAGTILMDDDAVGSVYQIHPDVCDAFGLPRSTAAASLDISFILRMGGKDRKMLPIPGFPSVVYDETIKRDQKTPIRPILEKLHGSHELLESVTVQDLYSGQPLPQGSYNATLRFTYRGADRTLTENEAKAAHQQVLALLN